MVIDVVDGAFELIPYYWQQNLKLCLQYASPLGISIIVFKHFKGRTTSKYQPQLEAWFIRAKLAVKKSLRPQSHGTDHVFYLNVSETGIDIRCTSVSKRFG